jgi:TolB-like protein
MKRVAIRLDSLAVVPDAGDGAASAVWSEEFARVIARHLAASGDLRVVPPPLVRALAEAGEYSPEEIARHFNARCVIRCEVKVAGDDLNVQIELVDALAESVMCDSSYLVSVTEALCVQSEIVRRIGRCCFNGVPAPDLGVIDAETYARSMKAKTLHREGRIAEALAISVGSAVFAEIVVDAPSSVLDPDAIVRAREAAASADDLIAARILCRYYRDWSAADVAFTRAVANNADPSAHAHRGLFLAAMRRFDEAEHELRVASELCDPIMPVQLLIERGLAYCGRGGRSAIIDDDRYADAIGHATRGELSAALDALDEAFAVYSPYVMFAGVDPAFVPLRSEPRFTDLLRGLRLLQT